LSYGNCNLTVCKFGGTSLADEKTFEKVRNIVKADSRRRVIVVSAPGKRFASDRKVTDVLYSLAKFGERTDEGYFNRCFGRFFLLAEKLGVCVDIKKKVGDIWRNTFLGEDYIVSRGEYLCALIMAEYLGFRFFDAADVFFFDESGAIDEGKTRSAVSSLDTSRGVVVPGFYGSDNNGNIKLFSRGGSDVSGAILAAYSGAETYENWTDVSGVYNADPNKVFGQKPIEKISYEALAAIADGGARVIHKGAIAPLKKAGVKLKILNTFRPTDKGTLVE